MTRIIALLISAAASAVAAEPTLLSEYEVIRSLDRAYLRTYAAAGQPDEYGAIGRNRKAFQGVFNQRHCIETIFHGTVLHDAKETAKGIRVMEYTFQHQQPDGNFEMHVDDPHYKGSVGEYAQSMAFFFYDLGHAILYLDENDWFQQSTETDALRERVAKVREQAKKSLEWLKTKAEVLRKDTKAANRVLIYGEAYYLMGRVLQDRNAMEIGRRFIGTALAMQAPDGYFTENGGGDTNYNLFSALLVENLLLHLAPEDAAQKARLWQALERAVKWQMSRILPDGTVSTEGNSRVKPGGETFLGKEKAVDVIRLPLMLYEYAVLAGDTAAKDAADRVRATYLKR